MNVPYSFCLPENRFDSEFDIRLMNETSGSVLGLDDLFSVMPIKAIFRHANYTPFGIPFPSPIYTLKEAIISGRETQGGSFVPILAVSQKKVTS
jgi:hypothetical protein